MTAGLPHLDIAGVILAGGAGRRMHGADKGLLAWRGRRLIEHALARVAPQVDCVLVSANRNLQQYAALGHPVLPDLTPDFRGPLAGIAAALTRTTHRWLLCVPVDMPLLPLDLAARLLRAAQAAHASLAVAHDGMRRQVLCALLGRDLAHTAAAAVERGDAAVWAWQDACGALEVDFSDQPDAFANLNDFEPG